MASLIRCQGEVQPDGSVTHVRLIFNGRSAGVLTLTSAEWDLLRSALFDFYFYSEKLITED